MKFSLAALTTLFLVTAAVAQEADSKSGPVPKSVLEQIGLAELEVTPSEDDPPESSPSEPSADPVIQDVEPVASKDATATETQQRREAELPFPAVLRREAQQFPQTQQQLEARRRLLVEGTAEIEQVLPRVAAAHQAVAEAASTLQRAHQDLRDTQASAQAAAQAVSHRTQQAAGLEAERQIIATQLARQINRIEHLNAIGEEFKTLAERFNDAEVIAAQSRVQRFLVDKQQAHAKTQQELAERVSELQDAEAALFAAKQDADEKQKAVTAAESRVEELTVALDAAREQLRLADLAKQLAITQLSQIEASGPTSSTDTSVDGLE